MHSPSHRGQNAAGLRKRLFLIFGTLLCACGLAPGSAAAQYSVSTSSSHTCALHAGGITCWGAAYAQPSQVPAGLQNPTLLEAGSGYTCVVDAGETVCWGADWQPINPPTLTNPRELALGYWSACAIDDTGLVCWAGTDEIPASVTHPLEIETGDGQFCALLDDRAVCWSGFRTEEGGAIVRGIELLNAPENLSNPHHLTLSGNSACVLDDRGATCWELGVDGFKPTPDLVNPRQIATGYAHACAIDDTGVVCWGDDTYGQSSVPANLVNPRQISADVDHTCVLTDVEVVCWGNNEIGHADVPPGLVFAPLQQISVNRREQRLPAEQAFSIDVVYAAINPQDANLSGLGLRMHWDSRTLDFVELSHLLTRGLLEPVGLPQADSSDFDGDPATDTYLDVSWTDPAQHWPGDGDPEPRLYTAHFATRTDFNRATPIRFSASATAAGYRFRSEHVTINPGGDLLVSPSGEWVTSENGDYVEVSFELTMAPSAEVEIQLAASDDSEARMRASSDEEPFYYQSLTFTPADWNQPQTLQIVGMDDNVADGDIEYGIEIRTLRSEDPKYDGFDPTDLLLVNRDNDQVGLEISPTDSLATDERGAVTRFAVRLQSSPASAVTLPLTSSDGSEGFVSPRELRFDADNWYVWQWVEVTGVADQETDGDQIFFVDIGPAAADAPNPYDGLAGTRAEITNRDREAWGDVPDSTAPAVVGDVEVRHIGPDHALIVWRTDEPARSEVRNGERVFSEPGYRQEHAVGIHGLEPGTEVTATLLLIDRFGNTAATEVRFNSANDFDPDFNAGYSQQPIVTAVSDDRVLVEWRTDKPSGTQVAVGGSASNAVYAIPGLRMEHRMVLENLQAQTRYDLTTHILYPALLKWIGFDEQRDVSFTTLPAADTDPPVIVAGPVVTHTTDGEAALAWQTDEPATSGVILDDGTRLRSQLETTPVRYHRIRLHGLDKASAYAFKVISADTWGNEALPSEEIAFTTSDVPDTRAPTITQPLRVEPDGVPAVANLSWHTDEPSIGWVDYGTAPEALDQRAQGLHLEQRHRIVLSGLAADTLYYTRAGASDGTGNTRVSDRAPLLSFRTPPDGAEAAAPRFSVPPRIEYLSDTMAGLVWETDQPTTASVAYGPGQTTGFQRGVSTPALAHRVIVTRLQPNTAYSFVVRVWNSAGIGASFAGMQPADAASSAAAQGDTAGFVTATLRDSTAPDVALPDQPPYLTPTQALLQWHGDEPVDAAVRWLAGDRDPGPESGNLARFRGVAHLDDTQNLVLTGLQPETLYSYVIQSRDPAGNRYTSDIYRFQTPAADTAPSVLELDSIELLSQGDTRAQIGWHTSQFATTTVHYGTASMVLDRQAHRDGFRAEHDATLDGLVPNTTYYYQVRSQDLAGNPAEGPVGSFVTIGGIVIDGPSPLSLAEGNETQLSIRLGSAPTAGVTLDLAATDDNLLLIAPKQLHFTPSNWNTPQTITLGSPENGVSDGPRVATLTVSVNPSLTEDPAYPAATDRQLEVKIYDPGSALTLIDHYYGNILDREADAGGRDFWAAEVQRLRDLGVESKEAYIVMAAYFFNSAEYLARNTDDTTFVGHLYRTFFSREPDQDGLAYWLNQLLQGMPRDIVMFNFLFSAEFDGFMAAYLFDPRSRAEVLAVIDFYRGFLNRLPDTDGFNYWVGEFRAAQCADAVGSANIADMISASFLDSNEYYNRKRTDAQFVSDMYNAFMRRGGELEGVNFWIDAIGPGSSLYDNTRERVRGEFMNSPEFRQRIGAIVEQGCLQ